MAGLGQLIGLVVLLVVLAGAGFIGYHLYLWSNELTERGKRKMEKKNMSFTKDGGLRVGVKTLDDEAYASKAQNAIVNTWNNAALPNYKSRLGWNSSQATEPKKSGGSASGASTPRPSASRNASSSTSIHSERPSGSRHASGVASGLAPPTPRSGSYKRSSSPVPGSFD